MDPRLATKPYTGSLDEVPGTEALAVARMDGLHAFPFAEFLKTLHSAG
ncbi:MAG: hypothetical protein ACR2KG_07175 [Nocardioidaceae bacterium]